MRTALVGVEPRLVLRHGQVTLGKLVPQRDPVQIGDNLDIADPITGERWLYRLVRRAVVFGSVQAGLITPGEIVLDLHKMGPSQHFPAPTPWPTFYAGQRLLGHTLTGAAPVMGDEVTLPDAGVPWSRFRVNRVTWVIGDAAADHVDDRLYWVMQFVGHLIYVDPITN